jgi:hypothetical protein
MFGWRTHTVGDIGQGIDKLGQIEADNIILLAETRYSIPGQRSSSSSLSGIWCLFFSLGSARGRAPGAVVRVRIAGKLNIVMAHGQRAAWLQQYAAASLSRGRVGADGSDLERQKMEEREKTRLGQLCRMQGAKVRWFRRR